MQPVKTLLLAGVDDSLLGRKYWLNRSLYFIQCIILVADMTNDQMLHPLLLNNRDQASGLLVILMTPLPCNPLLEKLWIGPGSEHIQIMVSFH